MPFGFFLSLAAFFAVAMFLFDKSFGQAFLLLVAYTFFTLALAWRLVLAADSSAA